jgi:hypothetical protein
MLGGRRRGTDLTRHARSGRKAMRHRAGGEAAGHPRSACTSTPPAAGCVGRLSGSAIGPALSAGPRRPSCHRHRHPPSAAGLPPSQRQRGSCGSGRPPCWSCAGTGCPPPTTAARPRSPPAAPAAAPPQRGRARPAQPPRSSALGRRPRGEPCLAQPGPSTPAAWGLQCLHATPPGRLHAQTHCRRQHRENPDRGCAAHALQGAGVGACAGAAAAAAVISGAGGRAGAAAVLHRTFTTRLSKMRRTQPSTVAWTLSGEMPSGSNARGHSSQREISPMSPSSTRENHRPTSQVMSSRACSPNTRMAEGFSRARPGRFRAKGVGAGEEDQKDGYEGGLRLAGSAISRERVCWRRWRSRRAHLRQRHSW